MVDLVAAWLAEEDAPFSGWDFSHLDGRMEQQGPDWDYFEIARGLMASSECMLDLETGGGENLLRLRAHWPESVYATENYDANLQLAEQRLGLYGVAVSQSIPPVQLDLVTNRHGAYTADLVAQTLADDGVFLTQQIHHLYAHDLIAHFGAEPGFPTVTLELHVDALQNAGFTIEIARDWEGKITFSDVGAVVYYLHNIPWTVPEFSVRTHTAELHSLQQRLERSGALEFVARQFLIQARKRL